jgi:hypothetical protein
MSKIGPSLCKTKDGHLVGKFCGHVYHFGRANDPDSRRASDRFKGVWLHNHRTVTREMMEEANRRRAPAGEPRARGCARGLGTWIRDDVSTLRRAGPGQRSQGHGGLRMTKAPASGILLGDPHALHEFKAR